MLLFNFQIFLVLDKTYPSLDFEIKIVEILLKTERDMLFEVERRKFYKPNLGNS